MDFLPHFDSGTATRSVHHFKDFGLAKKELIPIVGCLINSTLFYLWFIVYGNGRNVALRDIQTFPAPTELFTKESSVAFNKLFSRLMKDYQKHSVIKKRRDGVKYQEFYPGKSKPLIDEIDRELARSYGLTETETEFVVSYDLKFRLGKAASQSAV